MKMKITCKEATKIIIEKEEASVSFTRRIQLWLHLGICTFCKIFQKQNKTINRMLKQMPENETEQLSGIEKNELIKMLESANDV